MFNRIQSLSLSALMISKTHIASRKALQKKAKHGSVR